MGDIKEQQWIQRTWYKSATHRKTFDIVKVPETIHLNQAFQNWLTDIMDLGFFGSFFSSPERITFYSSKGASIIQHSARVGDYIVVVNGFKCVNNGTSTMSILIEKDYLKFFNDLISEL